MKKKKKSDKNLRTFIQFHFFGEKKDNSLFLPSGTWPFPVYRGHSPLSFPSPEGFVEWSIPADE